MDSSLRELFQTLNLGHNSVHDFTAYSYLLVKVWISSTISMVSNYNIPQISKYFNTRSYYLEMKYTQTIVHQCRDNIKPNKLKSDNFYQSLAPNLTWLHLLIWTDGSGLFYLSHLLWVFAVARSMCLVTGGLLYSTEIVIFYQVYIHHWLS